MGSWLPLRLPAVAPKYGTGFPALWENLGGPVGRCGLTERRLLAAEGVYTAPQARIAPERGFVLRTLLVVSPALPAQLAPIQADVFPHQYGWQFPW